MRPLLLLLVASATASAQPALFSGAPTAAPHWRIGAGAGLTEDSGTATASVDLSRTVWGPLSLGGRATAYFEGGFSEDDAPRRGVAASVVAAVSTRDRILDLRAFAGAGLARVEEAASVWYLVDDPVLGTGRNAEARVRRRVVHPQAVAGVGLDVYPFAGVGFGIEARGTASPRGPRLSEATLGLRVRLAR